jgi:hypothetical protein
MQFTASGLQAGPAMIYGPTVTVVPISSQSNVNINIPPGTNTIIIQATTNNAASNIIGLAVIGNQSGLAYRASAPTTPPYLINNAGLGFTCVIPVSSILDTSVQIQLTANGITGNNVTMTVMADTLQYKEDVFYNGVAQATGNSLGAAGTVTILNGPARLLTLELDALAGTGGVYADFGGGSPVARLDAGAGAGQAIGLTFPPDTILPAGKALQLLQQTAGGSALSVVYAYP